MKIGYLGPQGTFSEQAVLKISGVDETIAFSTISEVISSVETGKTDKCVVPIENSTEGCINITVDSMIFDTNLYIQGQINLPIEQNLMIKEETDPGKITKIYSHPQGLAQCRMFLQKNYPSAELISTNSTADGGKIVKNSEDSCAAIGLLRVSEIYGLKILHKSIQDNNQNFTMFAVLSKNDTTKELSNAKTSIAFSTDNSPGMLCKILNLFDVWDINMTKIISRPFRNKSEEYVFFADLESNGSSNDLRNCLEMVSRKTSFFKNLGSYPVYDYR